MNQIDQVLEHIDQAFLAMAQDRLYKLLEIPSISTEPEHADDCLKAANYLGKELAELGFTATRKHDESTVGLVRETTGRPVVVAHHTGPENGPHLLYYGHYDVQPAGENGWNSPQDGWNSPPFKPTLSNNPRPNSIVARGVADDKGQTWMWLSAIRAWHERIGTMPCPITVVIEGDEETDSVHLDEFIRANSDELRAQVLIASDTEALNINTPAITTSLRGLVYMEVGLKGAERDLHSGLYGGSALDPIYALVSLLGTLKHADGRIQIPGFYDGVQDIRAERRATWDNFDEKRFLNQVGLSQFDGERGYSALERLWARPAVTIHGVWGGYSGPGIATAIATEARAKVSFRLVPGQNPQSIVEGFKAFMLDRKHADAKLDFRVDCADPATEIPSGSKFFQAAREALQVECDLASPAPLIGCGGSIPVVETIKNEFGAVCLLIGFGVETDNIHSANENFDLGRFHKGVRSHARLLGMLGDV